MSRKVLKNEAKKAQRDATRARKALGGGMDVDGEEGALQFTFMATAEGMRACHFEDSSMHLRSVMNYISVQNRKGLTQPRTATKADVITN